MALDRPGPWLLAWERGPGDVVQGSCTDSSFSMRSAKALRVTSKGSKPKSSSCCLLDEPKPKAACQSVEEDTGIVSLEEDTIYEKQFHTTTG